MQHEILWPAGYVDVAVTPGAPAKNFTSLATLYNTARAGVDYAVRRTAAEGLPQIMIHMNDWWTGGILTRWFGALQQAGIADCAGCGRLQLLPIF